MMPFYDIGLSQMPRILGLMDRDPGSKTYGCCDRHYWHYKVVDFPNARMQEASLVLALAQTIDTPGSLYYRSPLIGEWINAIARFWALRRHRDGSTDESYPFERHFCSTAFTLYSVTESLLLSGSTLDLDLRNTGAFLSRRENMDVANQMACAASALWNLYLLTREERFKAAADNKITRLLSMQDKGGYFNEYGGFDLGYDSITVSFLAALYQKTSNPALKKAAVDCCDHMRAYIDEFGYYAPEGMSRSTQFLYPYGLALWAPDILERVKSGIRAGKILNPMWMDDRYCVPFTANYLQTAFFLKSRV